MTLLFADACDNFNFYLDVQKRYHDYGSVLWGGTAGRWGGGGITISGGSGIYKLVCDFPYVDVGVPLHAAFHMKAAGPFEQGAKHLCYFKNYGETVHAGLAFNQGALYAYQYDTGITHVCSYATGDPLQANVYTHIELAYLIDNSAGYVKVWVEGEQVIDYSGDTAFQTPNVMGFFGITDPTYSSGLTVDDLVVWAEDGDDFSPAQLGKHRITSKVPTGNSATVNFTPSTGTNYQNVDENSPNDDTDYNESSTLGDKDLYTHAGLSDDPVTIHAVEVIARKKTTGSDQCAILINSSGSEGGGPNKALTASYVTDKWGFGVDPNGDIAWTKTAVNALAFGVQNANSGSTPPIYGGWPPPEPYG